MKFVLIFWLLANASGYAPTGSAVFDDEPSCRQALAAIGETWSATGPPGVCVPQGSAIAATPAPASPSSPAQPASPPMAPQSPIGGKPCPAGSPRATC